MTAEKTRQSKQRSDPTSTQKTSKASSKGQKRKLTETAFAEKDTLPRQHLKNVCTAPTIAVKEEQRKKRKSKTRDAPITKEVSAGKHLAKNREQTGPAIAAGRESANESIIDSALKQESSKKKKNKKLQGKKSALTGPLFEMEEQQSADSDESTSSSGSSSSGSDEETGDSSSSEISSHLSDGEPTRKASRDRSKMAVSSEPNENSNSHSVAQEWSNRHVPATQGTAALLNHNIHPLEALYKRSKTPPSGSTLGDAQPFSFFGGDDAESNQDTLDTPGLQTPFTKQDLRLRGVRSGAPTPDTALIDRNGAWKGFSNQQAGGEDQEVRGLYSQTPTSKSSSAHLVKPQVEGDFTQWFWEHRGENNRAWKRKRREATKEQRQRDNRRKGMKGRS